MIVDDLGNDSGSDDDLGAEAKRIRQKHLQERKKLKKLGTLIPIDTEPDEIEAASSKSNAGALPLRAKHGQSEFLDFGELAGSYFYRHLGHH